MTTFSVIDKITGGEVSSYAAAQAAPTEGEVSSG